MTEMNQLRRTTMRVRQDTEPPFSHSQSAMVSRSEGKREKGEGKRDDRTSKAPTETDD